MSELPLDQIVFCWKKISGPGKTDQSLCPFMGKRQSWRPVGSGPWQCSGSGLEGLGRDPIEQGQEGERDDCRDFSLSSWTLFAPKGYSFLHLQNIFLKWETT